MFCGYRSSRIIFTATIRTFTLNDVFSTIFDIDHMLDAIFRYIHNCTNVSIQLGKSGKKLLLMMWGVIASQLTDVHHSLFQNTYLYLGVGLLFIIASTLILHTVLFAEAFMWVPKYTKDTLFVSAVSNLLTLTPLDETDIVTLENESLQMIGYACAVEALTLSLLAIYKMSRYRQVPDDETDLFLDQGRELSPMSPTSTTKHDDYPNHTHTSPTIAKYSDGNGINNHGNCNQISSPTESNCNQKPYIPGESSE